jgi:hypothetical protein
MNTIVCHTHARQTPRMITYLLMNEYATCHRGSPCCVFVVRCSWLPRFTREGARRSEDTCTRPPLAHDARKCSREPSGPGYLCVPLSCRARTARSRRRHPPPRPQSQGPGARNVRMHSEVEAAGAHRSRAPHRPMLPSTVRSRRPHRRRRSTCHSHGLRSLHMLLRTQSVQPMQPMRMRQPPHVARAPPPQAALHPMRAAPHRDVCAMHSTRCRS